MDAAVATGAAAMMAIRYKKTLQIDKKKLGLMSFYSDSRAEEI